MGKSVSQRLHILRKEVFRWLFDYFLSIVEELKAAFPLVRNH